MSENIIASGAAQQLDNPLHIVKPSDSVRLVAKKEEENAKPVSERLFISPFQKFLNECGLEEKEIAEYIGGIIIDEFLGKGINPAASVKEVLEGMKSDVHFEANLLKGKTFERTLMNYTFAHHASNKENNLYQKALAHKAMLNRSAYDK